MMSIISPTTVLVAIVLLYLSSFIVFAIIRIGTGVSIQRIGYFSLRRIAYSPRDGVQINIRGLGLSFHRPSLTQPTYASLRLKELTVIVDPAALHNGRDGARKSNDPTDWEPVSDGDEQPSTPIVDTGMERSNRSSSKLRGKTWKRLTDVKNWIKRLHRRIQWLALVDVLATHTSLQIVDAGEVQIGALSLAVDTRRKTMEKGKLFRHKKDPSGSQFPAEWILNVNNVLLAVNDCEPVEIMDNLTLNIHGILRKELEGLRDVSVAIKTGKLHLPYDDFIMLGKKIRSSRALAPKKPEPSETDDEISFADIVEELDRPGSREETIVQTVADSREFLSSMLRGIQEIQVALSFFRLSRVIDQPFQPQKPLFLNVVTHEVGVDFHRMDPNRPAHRMYFQRDDVAHQALLAAISLSVSLDDTDGETDKLLYIPMATTTIKTTLPSKTVSLSGLCEDRGAAQRNTNVFFANLVVTSPSIDLEPKHLSQLQGLVQRRTPTSLRRPRNNHLLISRLLPKASIKLSVHEPVLRFVLPLPEASHRQDYNMLVSSISSLSLDIESSHSADEGIHYSLSSVYRVTSHHLYYQATTGVKHRLLTTQNMEVKVLINATPEVCVVASGSLNTFSIHLISGEVSRGVHQVVDQFHNQVQPSKLVSSRDSYRTSILRRLPPWLLQFQFESSGFSVEVAGIDNSIGTTTRGMVLQLQGWTADYNAQKSEPQRRALRRRTPSYSVVSDDHPFRFNPSSPGKAHTGPADGRRLAVHIRGLEGFIMESADYMEPESFLSIPRAEVALSTSSDLHGPIFHINSVVKGIYLRWSLYRYYAIGIAVTVIQDAFFRHSHKNPAHSSANEIPAHPIRKNFESLQVPESSTTKKELITADIKSSLIQVSCSMPNDPPMLFQIYGLVAGRHRWSAPFVRAQLVRLHAEAPKLKGVWARIVSVKHIRMGMREGRRNGDGSVAEPNSIDISTDFVRLAVPHHMIMHRIFDNFINTVKSITQLNHRFKTRTNEYVLEKHPEGPRNVPRISLRARGLVFELEDDAFEWKLGSIYRLGLLEQKQRLARQNTYYMKVKKIEELRHRNAPGRLRTQSTFPISHREGRTRKSDDKHRSKSVDSQNRDRSSSRGRRPSRKVRYNPEGRSRFTDSCDVSLDEALYKLKHHSARSWQDRINSSIRFQNTAIKEIRTLFAGADEPPDDIPDDETILGIPGRPGLLAVTISDLHLIIDKPSFPTHEYAKFLHDVGKGMPMDTKYSLLIPMNIQLHMGEARANLRDYPLDLLHIPALRPGQSPRLPSWSLQTDFVIAEEFRSYESSRHVVVNIVPPTESSDGTHQPGFSIDVRRTVSPVKMYSNAKVEINTSLPTSISWGMSYQPVIQDMMKIIEGFTKPEIDPSERVGFWDKIRLSFHSRINVMWKGDGDVHLRLKGSRDPYSVTGFGAGFVMCWRKDVQWEIHTRDDPRELMAVTSGEYVLAIPDYSHYARHSYESSAQNDSDMSSKSSGKDPALFKKVIMKLSGNVRWLAGLVFERTVGESQRSFDFKPHYDVVLRNPRHIEPAMRKDYDAYREFRSNHIHLSVAVVAPVNRNWSFSNRERETSTSYNSVHLTPRFFTHFFSWWSLFSGVMSLPVRQGALWPGLTKTSKKFGRHLATVKYNLFFAPLFVSHIYKHKDPEDYAEEVVSATGLKIRLDSFMLDLHQRRELVNMMVKGRSKQTKASTMKINRAQLDFMAADLRAVSASIGGTNIEDVEGPNDDIVSSFQQPTATVDLSRFTIPDHDLNWIDMDDFVELDWILPSESNPRTRILPLAYSPRFSYLRQTDHEELSPEETGYSPFGEEPTHYCVMSQDNDPRRVQMDLMKERLSQLDAQMSSHQQLVAKQQLHFVQPDQATEGLQKQYDSLIGQGESLERRRRFLRSGLRRLEKQLSSIGISNDTGDNVHEDGQRSETSSSYSPTAELEAEEDPEIAGPYATPSDEFLTDFNNRFVIHNVQLKWNNSLRNIILRYIHQVSQRRGFVYYMSRRAVKFILDIVEEQGKSKFRQTDNGKDRSPSVTPSQRNGLKEEEPTVEDRIEQLLNDANRFVSADDPKCRQSQDEKRNDPCENIAPDFTPQNSYYLRLVAPQIQLQSEKNKKAVAIITAKGMQLKVVSIMDKHRVSDDVSGLVQRRFSLDVDGAQFFVTTQKGLLSHLHLYSGNRYGNAPGSAWPPWVSVECIFDFDLDPSGFSRIIQKTSASLRYDKYNTLRLKYNEKVAAGEDERVRCSVSDENRMDQITVDFSHVRAICDSSQYYAMYIIVLDLLMYSEPLEKVRSEKLEKIMLASDFSDLRGAPEMVSRLQQRIHQLEEIKNVFQIQAKYLDTQGWKDRIALEGDLARCEEELFFMMKAITTSQRKNDDRSVSQSGGLLRWALSASEIVWHLMKDEGQPLVEFQLREAAYERTDNINGSNHNSINVHRIYGLNLLPSALYPQIIVPYLDELRKHSRREEDNMIKVEWFMLEAIAGIPVLENFEVTLFPLKVQLERELARKLFEYIFPGIGSDAFENGGFSPFMIRNMKPLDDDESESEGEDNEPPTPAPSTGSNSADDSQASSGPGAIELRLKPTLSLSDARRAPSPARRKNGLTMAPLHKDKAHGKRTTTGDRGRSSSRPRLPAKKPSSDNLRFIGRQSSDKSLVSQAGTNGSDEKHRRFGLSRSSLKGQRDKAADDLSQMMSRASNYMSLTHVKINDVVLCLSYKGKGERNIEDVHDFVFRLPVLEYRNKTWSNLDLALRLKKDVIKALISHTPAILGNKFSHHRPTKQQQKRLREIASSSRVLGVSDKTLDSAALRDDTGNSIMSRSSISDVSEDSPRRSFNSTASPLARTDSVGSSKRSVQGQNAHPESASARSVPMEGQGRYSLHNAITRRFTDRESVHCEPATDEFQEGRKKKSFARKVLGSLE